MKYWVEIAETLTRIVEVDAVSATQAEENVRCRYRAGEIVLGGDDFVDAEVRTIEYARTV